MLAKQSPFSICTHARLKMFTLFCILGTLFLGEISCCEQEINSQDHSSPALFQYTEERPWGSFTILDEQDTFKVKRIEVIPGKRLSLQTHKYRSEHWVIVKGNGLATIGEEEREVFENDQIYIAIGQLHRIQNTGNTPLIFIETQCGTYLGEDDIVRYSDDFGRVAR